MDDTELKPSRMVSFRLELENIDSIDTLARGLDISRSQWFRRAVLAQLVVDLIQAKEDAAKAMEARVEPCAPDIPVVDLSTLPPEELRKLAEQG